MLDIPLTESSDYHASAHLTVAKLAALTLDLANFQIPFDKFFFPPPENGFERKNNSS